MGDIKKDNQEKAGGRKEKEFKRPVKETRVVPKSIVRIANKDLNGDLPIYRALTAIKGINNRTGKVFSFAFEQTTKIPYDSKLSTLNEQNIAVLEEIMFNPSKFNVPDWCLNHRREWATGENKHLIMSDLDFDLRNTLKRLGEIRSYKGLRHVWGLPVRGQRTKSTHRGKGTIVGVSKTDAGKPTAPAAAAPAKDAKGAK